MITLCRAIGTAVPLVLWAITSMTFAAKPELQLGATDVNALRKKFVRTFGQNFELLSDEVRVTDNEKYWLAVVRPRKRGAFIFRHNFERVNYGMYRYQDHEYHVFVGEKGSRRDLSHYGHSNSFCVGDSVIIPFVIGNGATNPSFSPVSRYRDLFTDRKFKNELDSRKIASAIVPGFEYIGRELHYLAHRHPATSSVFFSALFVAKEVGRFNLSLSPSWPDGWQKHTRDKRPHGSHILSVVIVPAEAPVTGLHYRKYVYEKDRNSETPTSAASGSETYTTSLLMLRPGDRVSLPYASSVVLNSEIERHLTKKVEPVLGVLPFSVDVKSNYNDWILKYVLH